jgi:hypothetical protein
MMTFGFGEPEPVRRNEGIRRPGKGRKRRQEERRHERKDKLVLQNQ